MYGILISEDNVMEEVKVYTHCLRCGRRLKNEEAQSLGYGRVCIKKITTPINRLFPVAMIYLKQERDSNGRE